MGIEILGKTNIDFIGKRKFSFLLSAVLVSVGIFSLVQMWRGQANLGIDFAGGTSVQLKFEKPFQLDKARHALEVNAFQDSELQQFTEGNKLLIQVKKSLAEGKVKRCETFKNMCLIIAYNRVRSLLEIVDVLYAGTG